MKNIIITPRQIRREVFFLIVAFVVANLMNVGAIIGYDSSWKELLTSIPILLLLSMVLYFLMGIFRLIYYAVSKLL
jgi:hypothetical protein